MKVEVPCLCKDCKYSERESTDVDGTQNFYCYYWDYEQGMSPNIVEENDFCSNAEPKENLI